MAKDEEKVNEEYKKDLQKALMESAMEAAVQTKANNVAQATANLSLSDGKGGKGPKTMSLREFQVKTDPVAQRRNLEGMEAAMNTPLVSEEELRKKAIEDAERLLNREAIKERLEKSAVSNQLI